MVAVTSCVLVATAVAGRADAATRTATGATTVHTGNATYFAGLGSPFGGCGLPQADLDSQDFLALNVQDTPGNYTLALHRPIPAADAREIGMFDNGLNCGRWVHMVIGDYCTGTNDGAPNEPFCRNGHWVPDRFNGASLDMIVADSCQDGNAWCRDDPYHVDLGQASLSRFVLNGARVGGALSSKWNNRHVTWSFEPAPHYGGDIDIGFSQGSNAYWTAISVSHLQNGIHGVDYLRSGRWAAGRMDADMGDTYIVAPTTTAGTSYEIRVHQVNGKLINKGRTYSFSFPGKCGTQCSAPYTRVTYTTE
jgi:hypothetical protein